jgi:hypothetical protein
MGAFDTIREQQEKLDALLQDVNELLKLRRDALYDSDRVEYSFVGETVFVQGDSNARDVVFTVPDSSDFVAERLALYPFYRVVSEDESTYGPNEESFRPCVLSSYEQAYAFGLSSDASSLDLYVNISETFMRAGQPVSRSYQNIPTPSQLIFSGAINYRPGYTDTRAKETYYDGFSFPTAMVFPHAYMIPAGGSLTVKVAPLFAGLRYDPASPSAQPAIQNEYKIAVVLEGYKRVQR